MALKRADLIARNNLFLNGNSTKKFVQFFVIFDPFITYFYYFPVLFACQQDYKTFERDLEVCFAKIFPKVPRIILRFLILLLLTFYFDFTQMVRSEGLGLFISRLAHIGLVDGVVV